MNKPTVVILAAGQNSRFFPFNTKTHKGNLELLGQPIIFRTLRNLESNGFRDVVIVVSEKDDGGQGLSKLLENFHSDLAINLVTQKEATGMGDALLAAQDFLKDQFLVIRPGLIKAGEISQELLAKNEPIVLCGIKTKEPWLYGIFELEADRAVGLIEKPKKGSEPSNLKIELIYLLNQNFLQVLKEIETQEYAFEVALDKLLKQKAVPLVTFDTEFPSLKLPWQLFDFQKELLINQESFIDPTAEIAPTAVIDETDGPVYIDTGAKVGHAARIVGPSYLGKNSLVGDFSFVRQSSLEQGSVVGANSELVRSIIMRESTYHFGYIADSIIGQNVEIGAGIITANKRLDRELVKTKVKDELMSSERPALGAIIGHHAKLGISVRTMPGVIIGSEAIIHPSVTVKKNVGHKEIIK